MISRRFAITAALVAACSTANAGSLAKAYADKAKNVHVVTADGKDQKLTSDKDAEDVRLSPDGEVVAWLVTPLIPSVDGKKWPKELRVYYDGRIRTIECAGIIREYWFWKQGTHVATDCGGIHFAGIETLYDVRTLKEVDSLDQARVPLEKRPDWSTADRK